MKQSRKLPLMRKLAALNVPFRFRLELTRRCNLRCIHCKVDILSNPENELTADEIAGLLDGLRAAGAVEIGITGGEVFARPDIMDVLAAVFERDFLVHISTNAAAITDEHIALLAANSKKILRVSISLYSAAPEIHDSITMSPGSHARTVENIFKLREAGVLIHCFTLLMKENADEAPALQDFYSRHNLPHQFNTFIIPREDGCAGPVARRVPGESLESLPVDWFAYLNPEGAEDPALFNADAHLEVFCPAARFPVITATGDVIACALLREPAGNIRESDFGEIWNNSPVLSRIRDIRLGQLECFSCELFPTCKPCIGLSLLEHGDPLRRTSEMCRLSHALLKDKSENDAGVSGVGVSGCRGKNKKH